jgi:hypothetical protein
LVAQPWTYKKIGGPSKLPKDFPPSQITPAHPSSYIPLCHMTTHVRYYISCHMILHHMTTHDITSQVLWHHMSRDNTCQILHLISHDITSHVTWQHILHHMSGSTSRITWYCITWQHRWHMTLHHMSHDNTYYITCHMIVHVTWRINRFCTKTTNSVLWLAQFNQRISPLNQSLHDISIYYLLSKGGFPVLARSSSQLAASDAWALSSNHNAKQFILIRCKHSQRAARSFVRGLEIRLKALESRVI